MWGILAVGAADEDTLRGDLGLPALGCDDLGAVGFWFGLAAGLSYNLLEGGL